METITLRRWRLSVPDCDDIGKKGVLEPPFRTHDSELASNFAHVKSQKLFCTGIMTSSTIFDPVMSHSMTSELYLSFESNYFQQTTSLEHGQFIIIIHMSYERCATRNRVEGTVSYGLTALQSLEHLKIEADLWFPRTDRGLHAFGVGNHHSLL